MSRSNPLIHRDEWKNNSYGILKEDYDNVLDYMEAIEAAMLDAEEDEYDDFYDDDDEYDDVGDYEDDDF